MKEKTVSIPYLQHRLWVKAYLLAVLGTSYSITELPTKCNTVEVGVVTPAACQSSVASSIEHCHLRKSHHVRQDPIIVDIIRNASSKRPVPRQTSRKRRRALEIVRSTVDIDRVPTTRTACLSVIARAFHVAVRIIDQRWRVVEVIVTEALHAVLHSGDFVAVSGTRRDAAFDSHGLVVGHLGGQGTAVAAGVGVAALVFEGSDRRCVDWA